MTTRSCVVLLDKHDDLAVLARDYNLFLPILLLLLVIHREVVTQPTLTSDSLLFLIITGFCRKRAIALLLDDLYLLNLVLIVAPDGDLQVDILFFRL